MAVRGRIGARGSYGRCNGAIESCGGSWVAEKQYVDTDGYIRDTETDEKERRKRKRKDEAEGNASDDYTMGTPTSGCATRCATDVTVYKAQD